MRKPLQDFSQSTYERPHHPWLCGLASSEKACPAGPNPGGVCPAMSHCTPVRVGDRWQCNRSPVRGGLCQQGPGPDGKCPGVDRCHPTRSLRSHRGRFVFACAVFVLGAGLMALGSKWRSELFKPGPLAQNHAQILAGREGDERCATCHEVGASGAGGWLLAAVWRPPTHENQSQRCLDCHRDGMWARRALLAHNVPPARLKELGRTAAGNPRNVMRSVLGGPPAMEGDVACATCHREHHGAGHDLTAISNAACQACHQQRYDSFAADHPVFRLWPYERRTRIVFDHAAHRDKHFAQKNEAFKCTTCHFEDSTASVQRLRNYEHSCAICHDQQMAASLGRGVAMFALPTIDVRALRDAGLNIDNWPTWADGEFDGRVPPFMKMLLASDAAAAEAMQSLGGDFEFADIDPEDNTHLRAAATLASASQQLLADLARDGRAAAAARLENVLDLRSSSPFLNELFTGFSREMAQAANQVWLRPPTDEASQADAEAGGEALRTSGVERNTADGQPSALRLAAAGIWLRDDDAFALRYRPLGHADPLLTAWLTHLVTSASGEGPPVVISALKELSNATSPGMCVSCHSIDRVGPGQLTINWLAYNRTHQLRGFTKFSHGPHLIQPQLCDCTHCHQIDSDANSSVSYADFDAQTFVCDFRPLSKQQCSSCHTAQAAGDRCQSCHHYHVAESGRPGRKTGSLVAR